MLSAEGLHLLRLTEHCPVDRERYNFSHAFDYAEDEAGYLFFPGLLISSPPLAWQTPTVTVTEKITPASVLNAMPACKMLRQRSLTVTKYRGCVTSLFRKAAIKRLKEKQEG